MIKRLRVQILAGAGGEFSSPESTLCANSLFSVCSTSMLPQWHLKDPSHSAKSAGGRLHLNMHTPLTQRSRSGLTMLLSRHSVGTYQETSSHVAARQGTLGQSSQLTEPLWTDPDLKIGISVRELIFSLKQTTTKNTKKSCRQGMNCGTFTQNPRMRGKSQQQQQRCF